MWVRALSHASFLGIGCLNSSRYAVIYVRIPGREVAEEDTRVSRQSQSYVRPRIRLVGLNCHGRHGWNHCLAG